MHEFKAFHDVKSALKIKASKKVAHSRRFHTETFQGAPPPPEFSKSCEKNQERKKKSKIRDPGIIPEYASLWTRNTIIEIENIFN